MKPSKDLDEQMEEILHKYGAEEGGQAMSKTLDEILRDAIYIARYGDETARDRTEEAKLAILDTIKRAKPDEVEPGLIWGENVARGYNKSIRLYEQNLMKELLGEQSQ